MCAEKFNSNSEKKRKHHGSILGDTKETADISVKSSEHQAQDAADVDSGAKAAAGVATVDSTQPEDGVPEIAMTGVQNTRVMDHLMQERRDSQRRETVECDIGEDGAETHSHLEFTLEEKYMFYEGDIPESTSKDTDIHEYQGSAANRDSMHSHASHHHENNKRVAERLTSSGRHHVKPRFLNVITPSPDFSFIPMKKLSLYMPNMILKKSFRYYFCHPYPRLVICYGVCFLNFLMFAEDPVAESDVEASLPILGNNIAFVFTRYPPKAWSFLKVFLWLTGIITGMVLGKVFHAKILRRKLRMEMFHDDQGSWMVMFLMTIFVLFAFSWFYNACLLAGGDATLPYRISDLLGARNSVFMAVAASGTWCGDFFTACMVTDLMLQNSRFYSSWAPGLRRCWQTGRTRLIVLWALVLSILLSGILTINLNAVPWDHINDDFIKTNELSRSFLAAFIFVCDVITVVQDWDFPHFTDSIQMQLPGVNAGLLACNIPMPLCTHSEDIEIIITGKWFNYGVLLIVTILDLNMWKNQLLYEPANFGQYAGPGGKIYTIRDSRSLKENNSSMFTFAYRNATINPDTNRTFLEGDSLMRARYRGFSMLTKSITFIPTVGTFLLFARLVVVYGRFASDWEMEHYSTKLRKSMHHSLPINVSSQSDSSHNVDQHDSPSENEFPAIPTYQAAQDMKRHNSFHQCPLIKVSSHTDSSHTMVQQHPSSKNDFPTVPSDQAAQDTQNMNELPFTGIDPAVLEEESD